MKFFLLVCTGLLAGALPALAFDHTGSEQIDTISGGDSNAQDFYANARPKTLSSDQQKELHAAAIQVLNKIADARLAIRSKEYDRASSSLHQADEALNGVKSLSPSAPVRGMVELARKHLDYQSSAAVAEELVPLASQIDQISEYVSTADAKSHLAKAKASLANDDRKSAQNELKLVGEALIYREVDLPASQARMQIDQARKALAAGKPALADQALQIAENTLPEFEMAVAVEPEQKPQRAPSSIAKPPSK